MSKLTYRYPILFVLLTILGVTACENPDSEDPSPQLSTATDNPMLASPKAADEIVKVMYFGQEIEVLKRGDELIFEGDIIIRPDGAVNPESGARTASAGRTIQRWANGTVYYTIASNLSNQSRVTNAIAHWESRTYMKFIPRTNQPDYIHFRPGGNCSSAIGRQGGKQNINLSGGCNEAIVIHEIGHAIGLYHEQSRSDRDNYININLNNVDPNKRFNFNKFGQYGFNATPSFDFNSRMLYGPYDFSNNGQPVITKKDGSTYTKNTSGLSNLDRAGIMRMYVRGSRLDGPFKYDLGTENSKVFGGYMPISEKTEGAIKWNINSGLNSRDRGSGPGTNDINRDFVFSSQNRLFEHPVSNGTWNVVVTFGDRDHPHDNMRMRAEGVWAPQVSTNANQFKNSSLTVNVNDGKMTIQFYDQGGSDPNWVVTRINLTKQ